MTLRQSILRAYYPILMRLNKASDKMGKILYNENKNPPLSSFYYLKSISNSGRKISFEQFDGKKVLIVNTASNCGYTAQYEELEKLYCRQNEKLTILGFPSNDFGNQEKGNDEEIAKFCKINFGINFPLMKKSVVIKSPEQNEVFKWLTDPDKNGWNSHQPDWNFSKYLVDEEGILTHYFGPAVSPNKILNYIFFS